MDRVASLAIEHLLLHDNRHRGDGQLRRLQKTVSQANADAFGVDAGDPTTWW